MRHPHERCDRAAAALGLATVVVANVLYLAGLPSILDPMMAMEPYYIEMARQPLADILRTDPGWGPLYALWLKPFVAALGDPLAVYAANLAALSVGVSSLIFLYVLALTRRAAPAVGAALFFLISDFNVPLFSKVYGFALLCILSGLTVSELVAAGSHRTSAAGLGVLLASYARPELYPAAVILCLAALWLATREARARRPRSIIGNALPALSLAGLVVAAAWNGTPVYSPAHESQRLLDAFREHFAWNWGRWHHEARYFRSIWEQEFGAAQSISQAFLNNPTAVIQHMLDNLIGTARLMIGSTFDHYPLLAPATSPALVQAENLFASAVAFGSLILIASRRDLRCQLRDRYGHVLLPYAALAMCSFFAAIVIYPSVHYLVIPAALLIPVVALATALVVPTSVASARRTQVLAALACLVMTPKPFVLPSAYVVAGSPFKGQITVARIRTDTITHIRSLNLPSPVHVLTFTDGIGEMLGAGFQEIKVWQKGAAPLKEYLENNHVDVIVSMEPGRVSFLVDDPYWQTIQLDPSSTGFTLVPVPNHATARVYVRTDLVRQQ